MPNSSDQAEVATGSEVSAAENETASPRWVPTRTEQEGTRAALALFKETFNHAPTGVWSAPGRVNLIGEHVDYAGGICLPFALSQRTYVAAAPNDTSEYRVVSRFGEAAQDTRIDIDTASVGPGSPDNWAGYVVGAIWAARENGTMPALPEGRDGFDLAIVSDVPVGAGLSSSAALECSVALAAAEISFGISAAQDEGISAADSEKLESAPANCSSAEHSPEVSDKTRRGLMLASIRAENEVVGASTGGLDQRIALFGQAGHALAIDFGEDTNEQVPFDIAAEDKSIVIINTNAPHRLNDGQYASRRAVIDGVTEDLGVDTLRHAEDAEARSARWAEANTPADVNADEWKATVAKRVRHVVSEIERTARAIEIVKAGDLAAFGEAMQASHASLRDDYEVTVPELDVAVDTAMAQGALGARMTGGGFGGSAIALVDDVNVEQLATAVAEAFADRGFNEPEFLVAVPSEGAHRNR